MLKQNIRSHPPVLCLVYLDPCFVFSISTHKYPFYFSFFCCRSQGMVAQYGRDIKSPRDLVGKAVGTPFGSTAHFNSLWAIEVLQLPYVVHSRPVCRLPTDPAYVSGCTGCSLPNPSPDCDPTKVNLFHISPEDMKAAWDKVRAFSEPWGVA